MFVLLPLILYLFGSYCLILWGEIAPFLYPLVRPLFVFVRCIIWRTERQFKLHHTTTHTEVLRGNNTYSYFWKATHSFGEYGGKSFILFEGHQPLL